MKSLFLLVLFLCFMALIIGLIKPKFVLWWSLRQKRSDALNFYAWGIIASAMGAAAFHGDLRSIRIAMTFVAWLLWFGYWRKMREFPPFSDIDAEGSTISEDQEITQDKTNAR